MVLSGISILYLFCTCFFLQRAYQAGSLETRISYVYFYMALLVPPLMVCVLVVLSLRFPSIMEMN